MLEAGLATPAYSSWSFPVVIASKKDGKPLICVEHRALNQAMKPDWWPLPKVQEIYDDLDGRGTHNLPSSISSPDIGKSEWQKTAKR